MSGKNDDVESIYAVMRPKINIFLVVLDCDAFNIMQKPQHIYKSETIFVLNSALGQRCFSYWQPCTGQHSERHTNKADKHKLTFHPSHFIDVPEHHKTKITSIVHTDIACMADHASSPKLVLNMAPNLCQSIKFRGSISNGRKLNSKSVWLGQRSRPVASAQAVAPAVKALAVDPRWTPIAAAAACPALLAVPAWRSLPGNILTHHSLIYLTDLYQERDIRGTCHNNTRLTYSRKCESGQPINPPCLSAVHLDRTAERNKLTAYIVQQRSIVESRDMMGTSGIICV